MYIYINWNNHIQIIRTHTHTHTNKQEIYKILLLKIFLLIKNYESIYYYFFIHILTYVEKKIIIKSYTYENLYNNNKSIKILIYFIFYTRIKNKIINRTQNYNNMELNIIIKFCYVSVIILNNKINNFKG